MGFRLPLEQPERRAHDSKDQLRRAEHYERLYRQTIRDILNIVVTTSAQDMDAALDEIERRGQEALEARW